LKRSFAALVLVLVALFGGACSGSGSPPTSTQVPTATPAPASSATAAPRPPAPAPPAPRPPAPAGRNELLGQPFFIRVGETVGIAGEDLVVTYSQLLSDNRCPPGVQCIIAGNARITVIAGTDSDAPVRLTLNTDDGPASARYLTYTVELVSLGRGAQPTATLRVT
jgi:hypothetical protein